MVKKSKRTRKKRYTDTFRYVFLDLSAKDLDPDKITKTLSIQPDSSCRRGLVKGQDGKVIKDRNDKPRMCPVGFWILDAHVHGNSAIESRIRDILKQIRPKKAALRRILREARAVLTIVIEPHKDIYTRSLVLPADILKELTQLDIDVELRVDNPQKWSEFRREITKKHRQASRKMGRKKGPRAKRRA
ncbi:MAG: DUF4279 domain-containing protein [Planctomycetota bacterium]|jgi:hypothetical protein